MWLQVPVDRERHRAADPARDRGLGECDCEATLGEVVGSGEQVRPPARDEQTLERCLGFEVQLGRLAAHAVQHRVRILAPAELGVGRAEEVDQQAAVGEAGANEQPVVLEQPDGSDDRRRVDG